MLYDIYHSTEFTYRQWVNSSHNLIRLQPRNTPFQTLVDFSLETTPFVSEIDGYDDYFGNHLNHLHIREPHSQLKVIARSCVALDLDAIAQHLSLIHEVKQITYEQLLWDMTLHSGESASAKQFLLPSPLLPKADPRVVAYARQSFDRDKSVYESLEELIGRIFHEFTFHPGFSDLSTPIEEVFEAKAGVCQDFSHMAITALRSMGLAVRYVSGYIETLPAEGEEKLFGSDASHAWFSVYFPGYGWFDFDPTNNMTFSMQHIVLGYGRDYADVAPMQGVILGSGSSDLKVMVNMLREETKTE